MLDILRIDTTRLTPRTCRTTHRGWTVHRDVATGSSLEDTVMLETTVANTHDRGMGTMRSVDQPANTESDK